MTLNDATDYIILKATEAGVHLNHLKLQKLAYYAQAWHLAFYGHPLFQGQFQAWIHGPVSRQIYDRYGGRSLYSSVTSADLSADFNPEVLSPEERRHIDGVLEVYAQFSASQLEEMTHGEEPWIEARRGYAPSARCDQFLKEDLMRRFYAARAERS